MNASAAQHGNTGLQLNASVLAWSAKIIMAAQEAEMDTTYIVTPLARAFTNVEQAFAGLTQAQADIATVSARPDMLRTQKVAAAQRIAQKAQDAATAALDGLDSVRKRVADELDAALRIKKPSGVDSATLIDKRHQLEDLIVARGGQNPDLLRTAACDLLSAALDTGDDLKAYLLSSVEIGDFLEAKGVQPQTWAIERGRILGTHKGDGTPVPGSQLWHVLAGGGEGTLAGFAAYARVTIQHIADGIDLSVQRGNFSWQDGIGGR